jgi:hypothetical protein
MQSASNRVAGWYIFNSKKILECLAMKDAGKFDGHLVYFTSISYILWTFGIFVVILVHFSSFGMLCQEKSGKQWKKNLCAAFSPDFGSSSNFYFTTRVTRLGEF